MFKQHSKLSSDKGGFLTEHLTKNPIMKMMALLQVTAVVALRGPMLNAEDYNGAVRLHSLGSQIGEEATSFTIAPSAVSHAQKESEKHLEPQKTHRLRVCNAYPSDSGFDLFRHKEEKLTRSPLPYKGCLDFPNVELRPLDRITAVDVQQPALIGGTFAVPALSDDDSSMLLLVITAPHDGQLGAANAAAVGFESHVFQMLNSPQVAVVDAFRGSQTGHVRVEDHSNVLAVGESPRVEDLNLHSVVTINPGVYRLVLSDENSKSLAAAPFKVLGHEPYVVLRVGQSPEYGHQKYPQNLVVFPQQGHEGGAVSGHSFTSSAATWAVSASGALLLAMLI